MDLIVYTSFSFLEPKNEKRHFAKAFEKNHYRIK
jgi:hypothetical protein